ncbi:MAG: bifunctional folylpolyglutamate synthase/dihydrofolate synthase [Candidatus Omnitrophica bacterium]|nr:bifunctional folylpolyglutamate synthase/dihydrofolate synthase [Candidatus Omnitrophota bacterium]
MNYPEAERYLNSLINYEKLDSYDYWASFRLDRIRELSRLLGDPHKNIRSIHIAGTKGKGSTAAITYSILKSAGFKVGLYTSPHLISVRERIRINDELISEADACRLLERIKKITDGLSGDEMPSFFEVCTALAYLYFDEKGADLAVYETGLGGRLDATNIIEPLVCAITPISYEHTDKLGKTLTSIAGEKAGIIKDGSICVSAPQEKEALDAIEGACKAKKARLILVGRDITFEEVESNTDGALFSVHGLYRDYHLMRLRLLGSHQVVNAATAIGIVEALRLNGIRVGPNAIKAGIKSAQWSGRMEIALRDPFLVLDGAQNKASAAVASQAVRKVFDYRNLILVLGVSKDKDVRGIVEEFLPIADSVILTRSNVAERALEPSSIREVIGDVKAGAFEEGKNMTLTSSVDEAVRLALEKARPDDMVLVTGSLFVVGEAKSFMEKKREKASF